MADAWHWFDVEATTTELRRVLKPGGWLGLVWNVPTPVEPWRFELADTVTRRIGRDKAPGTRSDAGRMVRLALDKAPAGARTHAVAEEGLLSRDIAAAIGDYLGLPTVSVAPDDAAAHFGWIGGFFGMDLTASSARTQELLGWIPSGPTLFEDIAAGAYALPE